MQLIRHLPASADRPTAVAIGNFDGLHLGHKAVIDAMVTAAHVQGLVPSVLTFEPHPRRFFGRAEGAFRIERLGTKLARLEHASVARVYMPRFDAAFAALQAEAFLEDVLGRALGAKVVVTGEDFAFGKGRTGSVASLKAWGAARGVEVLSIPAVVVNGTTCSSSAIRAALTIGDMARAAQVLGRDYALSGSVVHGDGRGAKLGFATANVALPPLLKHPMRGVYAVQALVRGVLYNGVANLGLRPTVGDQTLESLEVHLFDQSEDIYGARMDVRFIAKIRDEKKFDGLDALVAQIAHDCVAAKAIVAAYKPKD